MITVGEIAAPVVQVVTTGVDWPAVVAAISGGVVGVAGIYAAWRQTIRTINAEDGRAEVAEKRRIYAKCLAALNSTLAATTKVKMLTEPMNATISEQTIEETVSVYKAANDTIFEAALIGPSEVSRLALEILDIERNGDRSPTGDWRSQAGVAMTQLRVAMRADLDGSLRHSRHVTRLPRFKS